MVTLRNHAILLAAVLAAFGASLAGPLHLDDYSLLTDPVLASPGGWWEVWRPLQTRPLTYLTFWLNVQLGGGYHAVNLALHLGAGLAAFVALKRLIDARAALVAAALFAIHPVQAEAVNYVFARATLLMTLLCLISLDAWARGGRWLAVAWFAAALAAKEECAAFPLALVVLGLASLRSWPIAAMLSLSLAAGLRVIWATTAIAGAGAGAGAPVTPWEYFAAQGAAILRYLRLLIVPWGFTIDPEIAPGPFPLAWLAVLAAAWLVRKRRWLLAGLVLLLPSSSIFPASDLAADRRLYLPLIALAAGIAVELRRVRPAWLATAGVLLVALSAHRTYIWGSEQRLWTEAVERAPGKLRPRLQLARATGGERAIELVEQARALAPDDPSVPSELGRLQLEAGRPEAALAEFGRALALAPNDPKALNNRGTALAALGQHEAARADFERALARDPCLFDALLNLRRTPPAGCRYTPEQARALRP